MFKIERTDGKLWKYAKAGDVEGVRKMIRNGGGVNKQKEDGRTPLHRAAWSGHVEVVEVLLRNGGEVNKQDKNGETPLHRAAWSGHVEVVEVLLRNGAEVNKQDKDGETPLYIAAWSGHVEVVEVLLRNGGEVDKQNEDGWTPLHRAAWSGNVEVVEVLLRNGGEVNKQGKDGWTPLHAAAGHGHVEVVEVLLRNGGEVNKQNKDGWTPLHAAAWSGHVEATRMLAKWGANPNAKTHGGRNAMYHAKISDDARRVVSALEPFTSLTRAMKSKKRETVQGVLRQSIVQRDVNEMKASYNEIKKAADDRADSKWKSALTYAMHDHKVDMVFFAFETEDSKERDAIFEWISDENWIQKATFSDGSTLMQRAVAFRNRAALEHMLAYGLDPYESSKDTDLVSIWCQEVSKMSIDEMISSYERLQEAADALKDSERKHTLTRAMHDHKVEMLYCAFGTRKANERDAIIDWINEKKWIQTAKYEGGPTLMQRAVHSQNLKALERMICYRVEPEESINNHQLVSDSDEVKVLKSDTRDKVMEILKLQYTEHLHKLAESRDMSIMDRSELINSMLFFSTSMHDVSVGMNLAIEHLQSKKLKDFIQEGLDMATRRCFVYEKRDRDLFIKLIVRLEKRCLLSEEDKCKFLSEATTVNTENTDWVRGMKASIQKLNERLTSTEKGLKTLQNSYTSLVAALQEKDERDAENEKIRLAISLTCASLALFGGAAIKELLEVAIFVNDPGLVIDAITDKSEDFANEIVIKEGVKHVLEKAHISPGEFVAKLEEAKARMDAENEEGSDQEDADETSSRDRSAGFSQSDAADEHLASENEATNGSQDNTQSTRRADRISMVDVAKLIQKQQKENRSAEKDLYETQLSFRILISVIIVLLAYILL